MTVILVTMGGTEQGANRHNAAFGIHRDYTGEAVRLFGSARKLGINTCHMWDNEMILKGRENNLVLKEPSFGWAFQPIIIYEELKRAKAGDVVLWIDSNHVLISRPDEIVVGAVQGHAWSHDHDGVYYHNLNWTHADTFIRMGCHMERYWLAPQMQVNVMAFHKSNSGMMLAKEWYDYCLDYDTMVANTKLNAPDFREHRYQQSIWSIIVEKYNLIRSPYPHGIVMELMGIDTGEDDVTHDDARDAENQRVQ